MSELNKNNTMDSKTKTSDEQELKNQLTELRDEKERLMKVLTEREEQMANMFSYLQNFAAKTRS